MSKISLFSVFSLSPYVDFNKPLMSQTIEKTLSISLLRAIVVSLKTSALRGIPWWPHYGPCVHGIHLIFLKTVLIAHLHSHKRNVRITMNIKCLCLVYVRHLHFHLNDVISSWAVPGLGLPLWYCIKNMHVNIDL